MSYRNQDNDRMGDLFISNHFQRRRRSSSRFIRRRSRCSLAGLLLMAITAWAWLSICRQRAWHRYFAGTSFDKLQPCDGTWLEGCTEGTNPCMFGTEDEAAGPRYSFVTTLGSGMEGTTNVYHNTVRGEDVVVKQFSDERQPFRNLVPQGLALRRARHPTQWPTEIPASLFFNGSIEETFPSRDTMDETQIMSGNDLIPVYDVFLAPMMTFANKPLSSRSPNLHWHLVTPYLPGGTLNTLARSLQSQMPHENYAPTTSQLHDHFYPVFKRFLSTLSTIHSKGYCHNDIKSSNILVRHPDNDAKSNGTSLPTTIWYLADLGAVREIDSPLYGTWLWGHMNQWDNCRANDLRRALKVYLTFLREASRAPSGSTADFDRGFYAADEAWAAWYHEKMRLLQDHSRTAHSNLPNEMARSAEDPVKGFEKSQRAPAEPKWYASARLFWTSSHVCAFAVTRVLHAKMEDSWRLWKLRDWVWLGGWVMERY